MAMMAEDYPSELRYFKEHDWVRVEGDEAVVGITWFAQDALGDIVYADLPDAGTMIAASEAYGELESVKAVAEVYAPVAGEIIARNDDLDGDPGLVNQDPYGAGWLVRVRLGDTSQLDALMDAETYRASLAAAGS
jgi:glycine cleavage system H protein